MRFSIGDTLRNLVSGETASVLDVDGEAMEIVYEGEESSWVWDDTELYAPVDEDDTTFVQDDAEEAGADYLRTDLVGRLIAKADESGREAEIGDVIAEVNSGRATNSWIPTSEIKPGDLVVHYGMLILIEGPANVFEDRRTVYAWPGKVLNRDDTITDGVVPRSFLFDSERVNHGEGHGREDFWNVQGNDLATWSVVRDA